MPEGTGIVVGLLAAGDDRELADTLAAELPEALADRLGGDARWRMEVCEADEADALADPSELIDSVRRRLLDRGWQMGIGLTGLPLRIDRRLVAAQASASHGVGLVSIPALGAVHRHDRLREAAARTVEGLLGEADHDGEPAGAARMRQRSAELATQIGPGEAGRPGTVRFAGLALSANLRLLFGMIRSNRPTRVMGRLTRAATAALGTGAYAITSSNMWLVAHQSSWARLIGVALLSTVLVLVALVLKHGLWERAREPAARERVVLFNIVTVTTLAIGVASLYITLFVVIGVAGAVVIPPSSFARQTQAAATFGQYVRLAWFVASVATVGGAFGSLLESDEAVRAAAYRSHAAGEDERR